jgi:hypothetical protein
VVPGGSGGDIPGDGGWTGLVFWRFFSGRGLAIQRHGGVSSPVALQQTNPSGPV